MDPNHDMCVKKVWRGYTSYRCDNKGKYKENGEFYCGIHLPSKVKARDDKRDKAFKKGWDEQKKAWDQGKQDQKWGVLGPKLAEALRRSTNSWDREENIQNLLEEAEAI